MILIWLMKEIKSEGYLAIYLNISMHRYSLQAESFYIMWDR